MPKSVPVPVRQKLWERASQGESVVSLANAFDLPPRTVRHLLKRCRDQGEPGLRPSYGPPSPPPHAHPEAIRQAVLDSRRQHPTWGAELIRVMLADGSTPTRLAQSTDHPPLVPSRRVGTRPGRAAGRGICHAGRVAPSDLADRRLRAHPPGRPGRSLLAPDPRRGDRRRLEDGCFPPSAAGLRSTPEPPRRRCEAVVPAVGPARAAEGSTTARPGGRGATCPPTWSAGWRG